MIKVENKDSFYTSCQVCHTECDMYIISISDGRYGVELHLCKECCDKLSKEIKNQLKNVDKIN